VIPGIDISGWQEGVDWRRAAADGIAFVYVKATEGVGFVDAKFRAHVAAGLGGDDLYDPMSAPRDDWTAR
jgi:lysozyme